MKKTMKSVLGLFLSLVIAFSIPVNLFADELTITTVTVGETTIERVSLDELPEGVIPYVVESEEERDAFIAELEEEIAVKPSAGLFATYGVATVASVKVGNPTVTLKCNYGTSENNNRGTVTFVSPFTTFTGYTTFMGWEESTTGYYLTASGKDAYVYASGDVVSYLFINGMFEVSRTPLNISGYVYLVR